MGQGETTGAHADGKAAAGTTTEFESEVTDAFMEALRRAIKLEMPVVGTDTLLGVVVLEDPDIGAAVAGGMRKVGSLSGSAFGRAGRGWVSDDETPEASDAVGAGAEADQREVDAAWREARWSFGRRKRRPAEQGPPELPEMTGALRASLLRAVASARAEGTVAVRLRHVARALLDLPGSRAREAMALERLDLDAAAAALDRLDASARAEEAGAEGKGPESVGVALLRQAGTLGKSGNRLTRAVMSWMTGSSVNGSPVLTAMSVEAARHALRCGRAETQPVDLLLGTLALDRALFVAGRSLPERLAAVNAAPAVLRRHGVRQDSLVVAASVHPPLDPEGDVPPSSDATRRAMAVARLVAAEHGSPTVGTVHLISALLGESTSSGDAEPDDEVVRLLVAEGVDVAALRGELRAGLRAEPSPRPGA
ncbi:hypothetical protein [Streptomyces radicis]|uniref:Clp R domain-containing protein n=1 Tax=Streptomyces radicis TaxID=1750517 RepID=A0A3A9WPY8_9ACTN|nr:hypothetical protein [Streptomyces radicis]RKN11564.1 hypothetical protein D7319_06450 [Streptomyces radicis]RKN26418.1 hypothetical protein D7318_03210 [Streptomyces radicis]